MTSEQWTSITARFTALEALVFALADVVQDPQALQASFEHQQEMARTAALNSGHTEEHIQAVIAKETLNKAVLSCSQAVDAGIDFAI